MEALTVLGVDGGTRKVGFAVLKIENGGARLFYAEWFRLDLKDHADDSVPTRLMHVQRKTRQLIEEFQPDIVAIEKIRVNRGGKNMDSTLIAAQAEAAASIGALESGIEPTLILANQVSSVLSIKGKKRADKKKKTLELIRRLFADDLARLGFFDPLDGLLPDKYEDVADAIALALTGKVYANRVRED